MAQDGPELDYYHCGALCGYAPSACACGADDLRLLGGATGGATGAAAPPGTLHVTLTAYHDDGNDGGGGVVEGTYVFARTYDLAPTPAPTSSFAPSASPAPSSACGGFFDAGAASAAAPLDDAADGADDGDAAAAGDDSLAARLAGATCAGALQCPAGNTSVVLAGDTSDAPPSALGYARRRGGGAPAARLARARPLARRRCRRDAAR